MITCSVFEALNTPFSLSVTVPSVIHQREETRGRVIINLSLTLAENTVTTFLPTLQGEGPANVTSFQRGIN